VLQETCVQVRRWQDSYPSESPLRRRESLGEAVLQPDLAGGIAEVLRETGLDLEPGVGDHGDCGDEGRTGDPWHP
jgi:hypothetical protein